MKRSSGKISRRNMKVNPSAAAPIQPARDREDIAKQIADSTADLAYLARGHGLDALGYILEIAKLEAENILKGEPGPSNRARAP
jgi:hypothetical protein